MPLQTSNNVEPLTTVVNESIANSNLTVISQNQNAVLSRNVDSEFVENNSAPLFSNTGKNNNTSNNINTTNQGQQISLEPQTQSSDEEVADPIAAVESALFSENASVESSFPSRPPFFFDAPEPDRFDCKFVYNYFTPDERLNDTGIQSVNLSNIDSPDLTYGIQVEQGQRNLDSIPRYITINFSPSIDPYASVSGDSNNTEIIRNNIDRIISEGAYSNVFFTGVEFLDTGLEPDIYDFFDGSIALLNVSNPEDSSLSAADKFTSLLNMSGITGDNKKVLTEFLSNIQSNGVKIAPADVDPSVANFASDQISQQHFGVKFNNLFINDIVKRGSRMPVSVFQDEVKSLLSPSLEIQNTMAEEAYEYSIRADEIDYQNFVQAIDEQQIINPDNYDSTVTQLGYVISKLEVLQDNTTRLVDRIILGNRDQTSIFDSRVRYGATYIFKVRAIFKVQMPVVYYDASNDDNDEIKFVSFLIASEGLSKHIACIETVHPPPPKNIRVRLDYKNRVPFIHWQFPFNPQRDIKRFQIFRRNSINEPFTLIAEYDFDNSVSRTSVAEIAQSSKLYRLQFPKLCYLDVNYVRGTNPIYTVACVDAHGMSSNYGPQIQAIYDKFRNRIVQKIISVDGAPKPYPNLYVEQETFLDCAKISGLNRMNVFFDPDYYQVTQYQTPAWDFYGSGIPGNLGPENDLNLISVNPNFETYQIHMVNVDNQKDQLVKIKIADRSGSPFDTNPVNISANNLSFEFGTSGIN